jgi:hypothetical protein
MIRVCYRCKTVIGEKEPFDDKSETHGLCDPCFEQEKVEIRCALKKLRDAGWKPGQWSHVGSDSES